MLRKRRPVDVCLCVRVRQPSRCAIQVKGFQLRICKRSSFPSSLPKQKATASASPWPIESSLSTAARLPPATRLTALSSPYNFQSRKEHYRKEQVRKGGLPPLVEVRGQAPLPDLF